MNYMSDKSYDVTQESDVKSHLKSDLVPVTP